MKNLKNFLGLVLLAFFSAYAVDGIAQESQKVDEKEVIIITKKIDENGNEVVDKKVFNSSEMSDEELEKLIETETGSEVEVNSWTTDEGVKYQIEIDDSEEGIFMMKDDKDLDGFITEKGLTPDDIENIDINVDTSIENGIEKTVKTISITDKKGEKYLFELNEDNSTSRIMDSENNETQLRIYKTKSDHKPKLGVMIAENEDQGVVIEEVIKGSPAEKIGLQKGDIINYLGDVPITNIKSLLNALERSGEKNVVSYVRNGEQKGTRIEFSQFEYDKDAIKEKKVVKKVIRVEQK